MNNGPPENVPLLIKVKDRHVHMPMMLPKHAGLLNQMGEFEWAVEPEWNKVKA